MQFIPSAEPLGINFTRGSYMKNPGLQISIMPSKIALLLYYSQRFVGQFYSLNKKLNVTFLSFFEFQTCKDRSCCKIGKRKKLSLSYDLSFDAKFAKQCFGLHYHKTVASKWNQDKTFTIWLNSVSYFWTCSSQVVFDTLKKSANVIIPVMWL